MLVLDFPGGSIQMTEEASIVSCQTTLSTVSSAIVGGGFLRTQTIINYHVPSGYNHSDPIDDIQRFATSRQLEKPFIGMITAVPIHYTKTATVRHNNLTVASVITAGLNIATASGKSTPMPSLPGTINMIVLIDANLVASALINSVITATEAKTGVLVEHSIRTKEGYMATGTLTDALVIACTGRGDLLPYAGPGTWVGYLIGASIRQCLTDALSYKDP